MNERTSLSPNENEDEAIAFVLHLGRALHMHGVSAPRLESAMELVSGSLGLEGRFFSSPTSILAGFGPLTSERTTLVRVEPGSIDLGGLAAIDELVWDVVEGKLKPSEAREKIDALAHAPAPYGRLLTVFCFGLVSAAAAVFFRGWPMEILAAGIVGTLVGFIVTQSTDRIGFRRIQEPTAAAFAAAAAILLSRVLPSTSAPLVTLSGVIALLPGLTLTVAATELVSQHLLSGSARLAAAATSLLSLGFGVAMGARLGTYFPAPVVPAREVPWPLWLVLLAVALGSLGFCVLLKARWRDAKVIVLAGFAGYVGTRLGGKYLGTELGSFGGSLFVGIFSALYARIYDRAASVPLVPGILLLVPGSVGFRSVLQLLEKQAVPALETAFATMAVTTSLVSGLLVAAAAVPSKRPL